MVIPLREDVLQKLAVQLRGDGVGGEGGVRFFLRCCHYFMRCCRISIILLNDDWNELHPSGVKFAQCAVDLHALPRCVGGDSAEKIRFEAVRLQLFYGGADTLPGGIAGDIRAVHIVHSLRPVNAYADVEVLLRKELTPRVINEKPVGLQIIPAFPPFRQIFLLQCDRAAIEIDSCQRRLPAVPCERDHAGRSASCSTAV